MDDSWVELVEEFEADLCPDNQAEDAFTGLSSSCERVPGVLDDG
jgi:hypothetical protein